MFKSILNRLAPDITISVTPKKFSFKSGGINKEYTTRLYVSWDKKKPRVVGVGNEMASSAANQCIEIFNIDKKLPADLCRYEILEAFLKYAFGSIVSKVAFVRPRIIVTGSESLENILCGFQNYILKQALIDAGAREVIFK